MRQQIRFRETAAGYKSQCARRSQGGGGIGLPTPDRLMLNMTHAAEKDRSVLKLKRGQGTAYRVLCPALGISLDGIGEKTVEGDEQFGDQFGQTELADQINRLGDNVIVAMVERPA